MKKKVLALLLAALMVVSLLPTVAFAATESGTKSDPWQIGTPTAGSVTAYVDGTTLHIEGTGAMMDFGHSGSPSGHPWEDDVDKITTVVIGSGVTRIGQYAFEDCSKVANLYIDSIESWCGITFGNLESNPFNDSNSQSKLYVGGVETKNLVIPAGVTTVPDYAFYNWAILTSVEMPFVTSIGKYAFYKCKNLTSVKMPSVTSIGDYAFGLFGLTSVEMPSVNLMGADVFYKCEKLTSADIGSSITNLDGTFKLYGTFEGCSNLKSVVIRAVKPPKIENFTFDGCNALTEIIVPADSETDYKEAWSSYENIIKIIKGAYYVNVVDAANGTVTASKKYVAAAGYVADSETITLTVTPDEGYQLKSLKWYTTDPASATDITSAKSFKMPAANVTVTAEFEKAPAVHTHSFTYSASGAVLKATCEVTDCDLNATPTTLTLTAPTSLAYDGKAKEVTFAAGEEAAWTAAGCATPTDIEYYLASGTTMLEKTTNANSGAAGEGKAPVNVGSYVAKVTVDTNKTATLSFTITASTPTPHSVRGQIAGGFGLVTPTIKGSPVTQAEAGASVVFTAIPLNGYEFAYWEVIKGGVNITASKTNNPITITMPDADLTLTAHFKAVESDDDDRDVDYETLAKAGLVTAGVVTAVVVTKVVVDKLHEIKAEKNAAAETIKTEEMPMVKMGDSGDAVKTLQTKLNELGYNCGEVDGVFGQNTYTAVCSFQTAKGLTADGIVGKYTWTELL